MIKAFIFDLGGVYFEDGTDKFIRLLSEKTRKKYDDIYPIFRKGKSLEYRENLISGNDFFTYASNELGASITPEELNQLWVSQYTEVPEVRNLIQFLKEKGYKVSILSDNVPERIKFLEQKYGFIELFDDVILSYEVNLRKDSSEIFTLALERLNIKSEEAVFVDDREDNLEVAKAVGINTIRFDNPQQLYDEVAKYIQPDIPPSIGSSSSTRK